MHKVPGIEMSTGSLGQGFSVSVGMALAAKMDGSSRAYVSRIETKALIKLRARFRDEMQ